MTELPRQDPQTADPTQAPRPPGLGAASTVIHNRVVGHEQRQHPRFRLALRTRLATPAGPVTTSTVGVSRTGCSVRLAQAPAIGEVLAIEIELPDGGRVAGRARCRAQHPGSIVGLSLALDEREQVLWDSFVDEEETTGSLWRMIGRVAQAPDDAFSPRGVVETSAAQRLRFHTVGENGVAYLIAFDKHPSDAPEQSDLWQSLPGFREPASKLVRRVLREDVTLRFDEAGKLATARVVELHQNGWAYVQVDPDHALAPVGLVALGVGELLLVERNGATVFPHFSAGELEQIACDTFRHDLQRPMFQRARPDPVDLPPLPKGAPLSTAPRFFEGYDAVRFAQAASEDAQVRRYGTRDIYFHPSVWARVFTEDGAEVMGPTLQDEGRICVLGLVGPGAPRVVRLSEKSTVALLKPPDR